LNGLRLLLPAQPLQFNEQGDSCQTTPQQRFSRLICINEIFQVDRFFTAKELEMYDE